EIEVRRRGYAERAAAHIGAVEIKLEELLLGKVHFQPDREERLLDLALHSALIGQEEVLGELLAKGGAALHDRIGAHILGHGAGEAEEGDAEMLVEAAVFGGQHGRYEMVGQFVDRHGAALDDDANAELVAVAVEE